MVPTAIGWGLSKGTRQAALYGFRACHKCLRAQHMQLMQGAVWQCVLNKPALLAATASADFSACVWDAVTGDEKHKFAQDHIVRSVHFSNDSQRLLTAGWFPLRDLNKA